MGHSRDTHNLFHLSLHQGSENTETAAAQAESVAAAAQAESARREAVAHAGITASAGTTAHAPGVQAA